MDEEEDCLLPCYFSSGAYVEVIGHVVFGEGYEGSWHGAKVVRCHKPTRSRAHWTYDIELVERAAQARQRRQVAANIPADALRPHCPVQPFSEFCRLEPGLPEAPSVWWLGVVVQLEGCPIKDALVAYPVTPREAPGVAKTSTQLRPAFFWDSEMSCWCSIWQSPHSQEADVQKCFNSHFKRYMCLPKCARVGGVVPHVQAVGTDYISTDVASPLDVIPQVDTPTPAGGLPAELHTSANNTLPPLATMPPRPSPPLPPMPHRDSCPARIADASKAEAMPAEPPLKKRQMLVCGGQSAVGAAADRPARHAPATLEPCSMLRSHSGSISATHQPSIYMRDFGPLEATHSDAKFMCAGEKLSGIVDPHQSAVHGGPWKTGKAGPRTAGHSHPGIAWPQPLGGDKQELYALHASLPSAGGLASCSHSRAELKKHVSRAQLMRSSSSSKGVPGSVQLAAALRAAPDCSSPHAMESAATAAMLMYDGRDSGGSGSAVCASSDLSGIGTAERSAAGHAGVRDDAAAAAVAELSASGQWGLLTGGKGSLARVIERQGLANTGSAQLPAKRQPGPLSAAAVMQSRSTWEEGTRAGRSCARVGNPGTVDSLRMLADVREQEDAAVGLLCLRRHPDCLGAGESGAQACNK